VEERAGREGPRADQVARPGQVDQVARADQVAREAPADQVARADQVALRLAVLVLPPLVLPALAPAPRGEPAGTGRDEAPPLLDVLMEDPVHLAVPARGVTKTKKRKVHAHPGARPADLPAVRPRGPAPAPASARARARRARARPARPVLREPAQAHGMVVRRTEPIETTRVRPDPHAPEHRPVARRPVIRRRVIRHPAARRPVVEQLGGAHHVPGPGIVVRAADPAPAPAPTPTPAPAPVFGSVLPFHAPMTTIRCRVRPRSGAT
jgi:hypothetical protein